MTTSQLHPELEDGRDAGPSPQVADGVGAQGVHHVDDDEARRLSVERFLAGGRKTSG